MESIFRESLGLTLPPSMVAPYRLAPWVASVVVVVRASAGVGGISLVVAQALACLLASSKRLDLLGLDMTKSALVREWTVVE